MKALTITGAIFLIICGVLFLIFLQELSDPEVEGESGKIGMGAYLLSIIPISIGLIILVFRKK